MPLERIDTLNDNVFIVELSVDLARSLVGDLGTEELDLAMDEAQGHVFTGRGEEAFVVIHIK